MAFAYPTLQQVLKGHQTAIKKSGGLTGYKDIGMIESVLIHIQDDIYYPTFENKLTYLIYGLTKNHACNDGNKRMAVTTATIFIQQNTVHIPKHFDIDLYVIGMEGIVLFISDNILNKDDIHKIICALFCTRSFEELKSFTFLIKYYDILYQMELESNTYISTETKEFICNGLLYYINS